MIRPATRDDVPALLTMGRSFIQYSEYRALNDHLTDEQLANGISAVIDCGMSFVAVDETKIIGVILGLIGPLWFAPHMQTAVELAWWVDPAHRGMAGIRLMQAFENEAKRRGLKYVAMSDLVMNGRDETPAARILGIMGYTLTERMHSKEI
jgi:GNAT superfamily N-acetyltransferase